MPYVLLHPSKGVLIGKAKGKTYWTKQHQVTVNKVRTFDTEQEARRFHRGSQPKSVESGHWRHLIKAGLPVGLIELKPQNTRMI